MAPIKRKSDGGAESARPEKKPKPSTTKPSILREEEPAFPRGGASILTPLEHKQIQIQAKQDVLFEQRTGKKATNDDFDDEENDENLPEQTGAPQAKSNRKSNSKSKKRTKEGMADERSLRIEGLSYKVR